MEPVKKRVVVTGGSGKAGRACVAELLAHGYEVIAVDRAAPAAPACRFLRADLTDFGETVAAFAEAAGEPGKGGPHAVVHLAALLPGGRPRHDAALFRHNTACDYHVFEACRLLGVTEVVYASSETVLGLPFDEPPPYVPVDEEYPPRPGSAYSQAKVLAETMAGHFCRWNPALKMFGLRFSNVMEPDEYAGFAAFETDPRQRRWNLWGYVDARDAAQAVRLAVESPLRGAEVFIVANADTVMGQPNEALLAEFFPGVERRGETDGNATLLSIGKARRLLGYEPGFGWRQKKMTQD